MTIVPTVRQGGGVMSRPASRIGRQINWGGARRRKGDPWRMHRRRHHRRRRLVPRRAAATAAAAGQSVQSSSGGVEFRSTSRTTTSPHPPPSSPAAQRRRRRRSLNRHFRRAADVGSDESDRHLGRWVVAGGKGGGAARRSYHFYGRMRGAAGVILKNK